MADTDIDVEAPATTGVETDTDTSTQDDNSSTSDDDEDPDKPDEGGDKDTGKPDEGDAEDGDEVAGPETYADFSLPEGMELDGEFLTEASAMFKADGLTQEQAQKYVDFYSGKIQAGAQAQSETYSQLMDDWRTQAQSDKEFGGDNFKESIGIAQAAIEAFGTPELTEFLEAHGAGNHPEMIRFMVKVGRLTKEDVPGSTTGSGTGGKKDHAEQLYPT